MDEIEYLERFVFYGLENLNDGFDVPAIRYFSESDFRKVLERVEKLNIEILGMEPWLDGSYYDVLTYEDFNLKKTDSLWYWKAYQKFVDAGLELKYSASYHVPQSLLDKVNNPLKT